MTKRFMSNEIWQEDWFLNMPNEYKLFWYYMLSECNHAGIFKVNLKTFCLLNKVEINKETAIKYFNANKQRIRKLGSRKWFIEDFIPFQYGKHLNAKNKVHKSIIKILTDEKIEMNTVRGLNEVKMTPRRPQNEVTQGVKDKDKDKDKEKDKDKDNNINYLIKIPEKDIKEFTEKFNVYKKQVIEKGEEFHDYCKSKGKRYKNYKAALRNAIRKDYGKASKVQYCGERILGR